MQLHRRFIIWMVTFHCLRPVRDGAALAEALSSPGVWGAVVNFERIGRKAAGAANGAGPSSVGDDGEEGAEGAAKRRPENFIVDVLINVEAGSAPGSGPRQLPRLLQAGAPGGSAVVLTVPLTQVAALSSVRIFLNKVTRAYSWCMPCTRFAVTPAPCNKFGSCFSVAAATPSYVIGCIGCSPVL